MTKELSEKQTKMIDEGSDNVVEDNLVQQLAAPMIAEQKRKKRFLGRRNRASWKHMNRPEKLAKMETGVTFIHSILDRYKSLVKMEA